VKRRLSAILINAGKIILGILILAAALIPAVVIRTLYGWLLALFLIVLVLISIIPMLLVRKRLSVETEGGYIVRRRGEEAHASLAVVNSSFLACPKVEANVYISDIFGEYNASRTSRLMIAGKDRVRLDFDTDLSHIGIYQVGIDQITVSDLTGLFRVKSPSKGSCTACIMPKIRHVEQLVVDDDITAQSSSNTRVIIAGGYDYSGVREYALGDPMKQIHWKLSAHAREYMTKLQENNRQQEYAVILDFASVRYAEHEWLLDINDMLIETALSLVADIAEKDSGYHLIYADRAHNIRYRRPSGRSDDMEMLSEFCLICEEPDAAFPDACMMLREESRSVNRSTNILVVTSRPSSDLVQELIRAHAQRRSPELYVIVPAEWNSRETEDFTAPLRALNDYDIPYFVIATDVDHGETYRAEEAVE